MHKCIMHGQTKGKRRSNKLCKIRNGGDLKMLGENNNIPEIGEECTERAKIEILADEHRKVFVGKGEIGKIFHGV